MTIEPLDPDFQRLIDEIAAAEVAGSPRWHELTAEELRRATRDLRKGAAPVPGVSTRDLLVDGATGTLDARLYVPACTDEFGPGLVYFHGGGFAIGSVDTHDAIVAQLAVASGVKILSVDYRLGPEHRFPAAHDDALSSSRWAFDNAEVIGFDRNRIAIGGDSAGANLAAATCLEMRSDVGRSVRFQLLLYPNTTIDGLTASRTLYANGYYLTLAAAHHLFRQYVDMDQAQNPRIDLLRQADVSGLPSTFLTVGHCDILFDECLAYAEKLRAADVPLTLRTYPGFIHGFYGFGHRASKVLEAFADAGLALTSGLAQVPL